MDLFQAMQVFTRVVEANSFTQAADSLGLPRATVTTTIQKLERRLRVRLLNRTTRKISLTQDGASYYERCMNILAEVEEAEASFHDVERGPHGRLRIDVPPAIGRLILVPMLCEFQSRYPDIDLVIGMSDRPVNMVQEAVDCVIRVGEIKDSSMVARRLGTFQGVTCAAPSYLERHGEPKTIEDLVQHKAVHYFTPNGRVLDWDLVIDGESIPIKMKGAVAVNDADAYLACGLQGFGMIQPPRFMAYEHLKSGALVEVLPQWQPAPLPISVVYLYNRHLSPKVRVFVDWVVALFEGCYRFSTCTDPTHSECRFVEKADSYTVREFVEQQNAVESMF
ncbi:MAG TPA: LysR substrate-binding domain-containing protein [Rhodocyclaceae bacterium]|nr:LysR substrate-binding domain-containing protein [Rhodocyclaceae bacterium]